MSNETELLYLVISILLMLIVSLVLGKAGSHRR